MSITDELRRFIEDPLLGYASQDQYIDTLTNIAHRIDMEHTSACAAAYGDGVQSVPLPDMTAYVKLPVDADGVPIHIGDKMEGVDKFDSLKKVMGKVITISFESDGIVDVAIRAWNSDGKSWHRAYLDPNASVYHHHHTPTVEDVLREFASRVCNSGHQWGLDAADTIAEYAAKLRLAGGDAE